MKDGVVPLKTRDRLGPKTILLGACLALFYPGNAGAQETELSGKVFLETGWAQPPGGNLQLFEFSGARLETHQDLNNTFSLHLAGETNWQAAAPGLPLPWPVYPVKNYLDLEADNFSSGGNNVVSARLSRAALKLTSGRLEATAGVQAFSWGSASLYKPTDYFFPLPPLAWVPDQPLGSEALDASMFLLDDLSLEGALRFLENGADEWVVRLVNKGIGLTVTPSFARMSYRNGLGLEAAVTFPDFKVYLEGVNWFYDLIGPIPSSSFLEWVGGVSTVKDDVSYRMEVFQDPTGVLGWYSSDWSGGREGTYVLASLGMGFAGEWKAEGALVKGLEGGPLLLWPKASWGFSPPWEAAFQGQILIGNNPGDLALYPSRLGFSVSYGF